ncbi:phosphatidylcholine/phosphatidylserine synthase [Sphingobium sp. DEHP117]|uniref:CDP-alcohol phosphatidyltransferase family protein n=1 Tax=Sphingobium sp. DEHP117 TaxID=2993436 RepID=UPI0027D69914|nr:CDP-alcohol phosphatidyltransferase family protein [Sphingobium sp. DEHP117]MDQ4419663.1 phosphatidylcholine/phosphatidylserine synthase [Sphingobium sp. DEHP117]
MRRRRAIPKGLRRGISLRQVAPNAVTAMALCFGLTGVRFAMSGQWQLAVGSVILAGVLDGLDGRIARMLHGESRFGAELDSLSDNIAFGVAPAIIIYLWSLQFLPKLGWVLALAHALMCALRLARFNAAIDADEQPHKSAGFLTGVPAPTGAGLLFVPMYLWFVTDQEIFRSFYLVAPWTAFVAFLMISSIATFSWTALRLRRTIRLEAIAVAGLLAGLLLTEPWATLLAISVLYLAMIPFGMISYRKIRSAAAR